MLAFFRERNLSIHQFTGFLIIRFNHIELFHIYDPFHGIVGHQYQGIRRKAASISSAFATAFIFRAAASLLFFPVRIILFPLSPCAVRHTDGSVIIDLGIIIFKRIEVEKSLFLLLFWVPGLLPDQSLRPVWRIPFFYQW